MTQEAKWNSKYIEVMESSVFFEVKEGTFVEHEVDGYWRRRGL